MTNLHTKQFSRVLLAVALLLSLFCLSASAEYAELTQGIYYGQSYVWSPSYLDGSVLQPAVVSNPNAVPGCTIIGDMNGIYITGTPSAAGYYYTTAEVYCSNAGGPLSLDFTILGSVSTQYTGSFTATEGINVPETTVVNVNNYIQSSTVTGGRLPQGMSYRQYDTYFTVYGTPTESGYFTVEFSCQTEGAPCNVTLNVNVIAAPKVLTVTKSPSSETVEVGGSASFISTAEAYSDVEWRIVSADGSACWRGKAEIESKFRGVQVYIYQDETGREWLSLKNIPLEMNGYYIQTKFWSIDKTTTAFTAERSCLLTVKQTKLEVPVINTQPASLTQTIGTAATLSVNATDPNRGTLQYQWYRNTTNSATGGQLIAGATNASYTPPQTEGTVYYYASVTSTKNNVSSTPVTTAVASVTYAAAAPAVTPTPLPTTDPNAGQANGQNITPTPQPTPSPQPMPVKKSSSLLQVFLLAAIMLLCVAAAVLIFLMRRDAKRDEEEDYEYEDAFDDEDDDEEYEAEASSRGKPLQRLVDAAGNAREAMADRKAAVDASRRAANTRNERTGRTPAAPGQRNGTATGKPDSRASHSAVPTLWLCPECGAENSSRFCADCGAARPHEAPAHEEEVPMIYFCASCGWAPPDPAHPPKFCIECGSLMAPPQNKS